MNSENQKAILLLIAPDQPGIISKVSTFVFEHQGNIVDMNQHTDPVGRMFFMRVEWEMNRFTLPTEELKQKLNSLTQSLQGSYELFFSNHLNRMAIFVSKYDHCLYDLLVRREAGEFKVEIPFILSNHPDLKPVADHFNIPFKVISVTKENKKEAEEKSIELLKSNQIDLIVLARYMQVLSPEFVRIYPNRIINIHHSFLPAFIGAKPYHQAYERGVKLIGATSHYVTEIIDEGPIIQQSVARVTHQDQVEDLVRKGRDQEKAALAHAVRMHLEHRILTDQNRTIVFE